MRRTVTTSEPRRAGDEPQLLTIPQAARRLNASRGYVYALLKRGELPHIELPSSGSGRRAGAIRIDPADLEAAIAARRKGGAA